ncbi:hypothetical protein BD408DRAFT_349757 [Parasitella parasitica]|nr:hypothetical protein BD408DRAFT_349757 [Parasitella parasitica]
MVPISFQGSFEDVISKTEGTRAVDWLDFLLYFVPTIVVPFIRNPPAQKAILSLIKGCALALQWELTDEKYLILFSHFKRWHTYLSKQVDEHNVSRSVFRPVMRYLTHIPLVVRRLGPLRAYSTRSMERSIGVFSKLIKSKRDGGKNASNLIERLAVHNFVDHTLDIDKSLKIIKPRACSDKSFKNLPNDPNGPQLWEPFRAHAVESSSAVEGVQGSILLRCLRKYYQRATQAQSLTMNTTITIAGRLLKETTRWYVGAVKFYLEHRVDAGTANFLAFVEVMNNHFTASHDHSVPLVKRGNSYTKYAIINVSDIKHQVGLIEYPRYASQYYVIAPYFVFD